MAMRRRRSKIPAPAAITIIIGVLNEWLSLSPDELEDDDLGGDNRCFEGGGGEN